MAGTPLILQQDAEQTSVWLEDYFNRLDSAKAPRLLAAMRYSAMNGGKRVRASLVLSAARLASANTRAPLPAHLAVAGAVEMLHAYSLIHDDLPAMDDADLRRGVAACHKAFDEATAILAGDALQTEAFYPVPPGINGRCRTAITPDSDIGRCIRARRYGRRANAGSAGRDRHT